jgi:cytochrome c-type biogenesis protein CcmH
VRRALALAAAVLALAAPALAAEAPRRFNPTDAYRELRCPTCNTPLDVSNAPIAQRMKAFILERWEQGWSKQQVVDALVEEFGREVLATPPKSGFDLVAWIVPGLGVAVGLGALVLLTALWTRRRREVAAEPAPVSDADSARLERELERFGGP